MLTSIPRRRIYTILNWVVIVMSVALVAYLSVSILGHGDFMHDTTYMHFQLLVCVVFLLVWLIELLMAHRKRHYLWKHALFFLLCVPYVNILAALHVTPGPDVLYYIHFLPLARGVLAGGMVVGYISSNRITGIFFSYLTVLIAFIYFGSIIFYARELGVNTQLQDYWQALWWACSDATTTGCVIQPVTPAGKITGAILAVMGMIMFPLFTVYITSAVRSRLTSSKTEADPRPAA